MARLTQVAFQWWVAMLLGAAGFVKEMLTTKDVAVLTICTGLMMTPAVFTGKQEPE